MTQIHSDTDDHPEPKRSIIAIGRLPKRFPTHQHAPLFWENLGRTIGTFGFLEEILGKATFALTATREYPDDELEGAISAWLPTLEKALVEPLGGLIDLFGKAVRENNHSTIQNLDDLLKDLRQASAVRNVLCHGSWQSPDELGRSTPFFVNRKLEVFATAIDNAFLEQTQLHVAGLACAVIDVVVHMGWRFPGWSGGPGNPIVPESNDV